MSQILTKPLDKARTLAKMGNYDDAVYLGKWRFYEVFKPIRNDGVVRYTGFPSFILQRLGKWRWSKDWRESRRILNKFPKQRDE